MQLKGKVINFLGDSITEGARVEPGEPRFFEVLEAEYGLAKANGYGIGGTRIARNQTPSEYPEWDQYFASRIPEMADADMVVVFGGTNDFGHGDAPVGWFSDRTPDTFYGACHDLFTRLIERYPGKPIVVMTPLHRLEEDDVHQKPDRPTTLMTYVKIIREVAEYYSLPVCDLFAYSGLQPKVPVIQEKYVPDGLHPNAAGHRILAERLAGFLLSL